MGANIEGMAALVTGGGTGIGAAVARSLAAKGVQVAINYATSRDKAEALAREIGNGAIAVQADIADDAQCRALAEAAREAFGRLDFLVNNAGRTKHVNHEDLDGLSADDFIDIYRLNTVAAFQMIRACAPALREGPASAVVNVASVAGVFGMGSSVAYACSKGALITMTKSMARVLAPKIRVNAVAPGYVGTGWFSEKMPPEAFDALNQRIASQVPMNIATLAEDVAAPIVHLLDPAMRSVTGETMLVDAGGHLDVALTRRPGREL